MAFLKLRASCNEAAKKSGGRLPLGSRQSSRDTFSPFCRTTRQVHRCQPAVKGKWSFGMLFNWEPLEVSTTQRTGPAGLGSPVRLPESRRAAGAGREGRAQGRCAGSPRAFLSCKPQHLRGLLVFFALLIRLSPQLPQPPVHTLSAQ